MNYRKRSIKGIILLGILPVMVVNNAYADEDENYLKLAEKLVALRGQVSDLSNELQQIRDEHKLEMRGLISQKNTLNGNIRQEEITIDQLQESLLENKKIIKEMGADKETIKGALLTEVEKFKMYIETGLPFKVKERMQSLEGFERNLQAGVLSSHKAVNILWSMIEDELKLARDNGVYRQSVTLNKKDNLAHVARIGMVMMYFRIADEEYGVFRKKDNSWVAEVSTDAKSIEQIKDLFASMERQIHVGYFKLPNAL